MFNCGLLMFQEKQKITNAVSWMRKGQKLAKHRETWQKKVDSFLANIQPEK